MDTGREKHAELAQGVITRQATNSFTVKGWSITLVSALLAVAATSDAAAPVAISFGVAIAFAALDLQFLAQERQYRLLYEDIIVAGTTTPLLSLDASKYPTRKMRIVRTPAWALFHVPVVVTCGATWVYVLAN